VGETTGIVLYFGSVGPGHGLEKAISSMRLWPLDSVLVLAGPTPASYRATLQQSAMQSGIGNRLIFMGTISPEMAWGVRAGADVALTIMDTSHPIYRYCAGASNKRFEAMAAGVAQVTNDGPGIDELFVNRGVLVSAPYDNSERIGSAVADLLTNAGRRREMAAKARHLHLTDYNYEKQFAPVLAELCERISAKPSERN
jgi:glycosyltransferase involved in cell wall biosynthesis